MLGLPTLGKLGFTSCLKALSSFRVGGTSPGPHLVGLVATPSLSQALAGVGWGTMTPGWG